MANLRGRLAVSLVSLTGAKGKLPPFFPLLQGSGRRIQIDRPRAARLLGKGLSARKWGGY